MYSRSLTLIGETALLNLFGCSHRGSHTEGLTAACSDPVCAAVIRCIGAVFVSLRFFGDPIYGIIFALFIFSFSLPRRNSGPWGPFFPLRHTPSIFIARRLQPFLIARRLQPFLSWSTQCIYSYHAIISTIIDTCSTMFSMFFQRCVVCPRDPAAVAGSQGRCYPTIVPAQYIPGTRCKIKTKYWKYEHCYVVRFTRFVQKSRAHHQQGGGGYAARTSVIDAAGAVLYDGIDAV